MSEKSFNINNSVKVKLTEKGKMIFAEYWARLDSYLPPSIRKKKAPKILTIDDNGYTSFQLWCLMEMFGEHLHIGTELPFEAAIIVDENDLQDVEVEK